MGRFYLDRRVLLVLLACVWPAAAGGQTPMAMEPPVLGNTLPIDAIADLPSGGNLFTLLDTSVPQVITERVDTGGIGTGRAARTGAHGSTWTQTRYHVDGVDITSSDGSGAPMLLPGVLAWDRVYISTGRMPLDINAPGLAVSLVPRRPAPQWTRIIEALDAPASLIGRGRNTPPAIARLNTAARANVLLSGPVVPNRVGMVLAGSWGRSSLYERADPTLLTARHASLFSQFVFTLNPTAELRVIGWADRSRAPLENRLALGQASATDRNAAAHGQAVLERRLANGASWSAYGAYTARRRTNDAARVSSIVLERITDGPPAALVYPGPGRETRWSFGSRLKEATLQTAAVQNTPQFGVELSGGRMEMSPGFTGRIGELVNGLPARVWTYGDPGPEPARWRSLLFAAYAADRTQLSSRVTIDFGMRFEWVTGSTLATRNAIAWRSLLPRAGIRWELFQAGSVAALAGFGRTAHQMTLTDLAWGDPVAPSGTVSRWNTPASTRRAPLASEIGTPIARVGPGGTFSSIDENLRRPYMDELAFGFEARPWGNTVLRLLGLGRRENDLISVVDASVPESAYTQLPLVDPGLYGQGQVLPMFNRPVSTFGQDRYVLTNPEENGATFVGAEFTGQTTTPTFFLLFGLTAGRSEGLAANRGFRAIENDYGVRGELFTDPNARVYAQGRPFTERGYTIKVAGVYRFPFDTRLGIAARYQDGEHFSRFVVVPNLNQGPELIRAFRNGRTRFTYTLTVDGRLQKGFTVGACRLAAVLEVYNALNTGREIEESQISGPTSRTTTAVQPPRAVHAGIRIEF
jgi:hypothetical protein